MLQTIERLQSLHTLVLEGFDMNKNIMAAIGRLKNLQSLSISYLFLSQHLMYPMLNLSNLKELDPGHCFENFDGFLIKLADKLKNLTVLRLLNPYITDIGILALTKLEKLKKFSIANGRDYLERNITDASIKKFENMQDIDLIGYKTITDESIMHIIDNSPDLEMVALKKTGITIKSVQHALNSTRNRINNKRMHVSIDLDPMIRNHLQGNIPSHFDFEFI